MNKEDKKWMDILIQDKGEKYNVIVDNDLVWVEDKEQLDEDGYNDVVYNFYEYGWHFIVQLMKYLGLDCEEV